MRRFPAIILAAAFCGLGVSASILTSCAGDTAAPDAGKPQGSLGGPCYANNTCDSGLGCVLKAAVGVCVQEDGGAVGDAAANEAGQDATADSPGDANSCTDGTKNGNETDVDCGGPSCGACRYAKACLAPGDCLSVICTGNHCDAPSSCMDGLKGQQETSLDCGGGNCPPCASGNGCAVNADCTTNVCMSNMKCQ